MNCADNQRWILLRIRVSVQRALGLLKSTDKRRKYCKTLLTPVVTLCSCSPAKEAELSARRDTLCRAPASARPQYVLPSDPCCNGIVFPMAASATLSVLDSKAALRSIPPAPAPTPPYWLRPPSLCRTPKGPCPAPS